MSTGPWRLRQVLRPRSAPDAAVSPFPPSEEPLATAARALARRDRGLDDALSIEAWRRAAPEHAAALAAIEALWRQLDRLRTLCPTPGYAPDPDLLHPDPPRWRDCSDRV